MKEWMSIVGGNSEKEGKGLREDEEIGSKLRKSRRGRGERRGKEGDREGSKKCKGWKQEKGEVDEKER